MTDKSPTEVNNTTLEISQWEVETVEEPSKQSSLPLTACATRLPSFEKHYEPPSESVKKTVDDFDLDIKLFGIRHDYEIVPNKADCKLQQVVVDLRKRGNQLETELDLALASLNDLQVSTEPNDSTTILDGIYTKFELESVFHFQAVQYLYQTICSLSGFSLCSENGKLKLNDDQLPLLNKCLETFKSDVIKISKNRYQKLKNSQKKENLAMLLFHFSKIENEVIDFEKRIVLEVLEYEAEEQTEVELWNKKADMEFHWSNLDEMLTEIKKLFDEMEEFMENDDYIDKQEELSPKLTLMAFCTISAHCSYQEVCYTTMNRKKIEFEKFHFASLNWIFWFLITLEERKSSPPSIHQKSNKTNHREPQRTDKLTIFHSSV